MTVATDFEPTEKIMQFLCMHIAQLNIT